MVDFKVANDNQQLINVSYVDWVFYSSHIIVGLKECKHFQIISYNIICCWIILTNYVLIEGKVVYILFHTNSWTV